MIPFSPPRIDQKTIDAVTDTLQSGWITTGPKTKLFESRLKEYTGASAVFCCNAATNGLELLMRWLGVGPGDEVIIPAYTYCATGNVVVHLGATPVLVDVREDFTIDPSEVQKAITPKTKAIVPVDIGGLPVDYNALWKLIEDAAVDYIPANDRQSQLGRIALVADAAHSLGAFYGDVPIGTHADAVVFSFHAAKNLTTAEGGAICLNLPEGFDHEEAYRWLNVRSLHGQSKDALAKTKKNAWEYDVEEAGWKCNMTDIQAAMGLVELERYNAETLAKRRQIVERYQEAFAECSWAILPTVADEDRQTSYHLYLLRVKGASLAQRNAVIQGIFDREVSVNVHYKPLPLLSYYKNQGYTLDAYPITKSLWENEISLPVYYDLSMEQVETVIQAVKDSVEEVMA